MFQIGVLFDIDELGGGLYGYAAYKVLFAAVDVRRLWGCSLRDGDTTATLQGRARQCCIGVESADASKIASIKDALTKCEAKGLLPVSRRFQDDATVRGEPLVFAGRISETGVLTGCDTDWVMAAWQEAGTT